MNRLAGLVSVLLCVVAVLAVAAPARAFTVQREWGGVSVTVHAPDWTWQKRDINILLIARNPGDVSVAIPMRCVLPEGLEDHFTWDGNRELTLTALPGETARACFSGITALDGVPTGDYAFAITLGTGASAQGIEYPVRTIRGAAVNPGPWALYLPALLALLWCVVFAGALVYMGGWRAWREHGEPIGFGAK